jgi:hypothetical protein
MVNGNEGGEALASIGKIFFCKLCDITAVVEAPSSISLEKNVFLVFFFFFSEQCNKHSELFMAVNVMLFSCKQS